MARQQLIDAARIVSAGDALLSPSVTDGGSKSSPALPAPSRDPAPALEHARGRGAWLVAKGLSNPEIAQTLVLSGTTIKTHVSQLLMKLEPATASKPSSSRTR
jgi:DNA-binding NarL/FixJ family response regulator